VASIEDAGRHVSVITTNGRTFKGRKAIVSVPSTMYRGLNFSPALPARLRDVADATVLGDYNKAIVCYDRPWWRDLGYNGICMSFVGPIVVARDTSVDDKGLYALTCFVNGPQGGAWGDRPPHERRAVVLDQIAAMYGVGLDSEAYRPIEIFEQVWKHEPYSQGALVPVTHIGHLTEYADVYGKPVGNIHFVGTEYSAEWKGYMEGALCSGEAGAAEVADALQRGAKANL
jgi:monoamine oxidase